MKKAVAACAALVFAASALAQDWPVPKMFRGIDKQKGQYQVEVLEASGSAGSRKVPVMTICTDNLMKPPAGKERAR